MSTDGVAGVTTVVADTVIKAKRLAETLGVEDGWLFSPRTARTFEGLRASLVLIDAEATIPADFMATIRATVLKMPPRGGRIIRVAADDITFRDK